jgi:hypothetical protein
MLKKRAYVVRIPVAPLLGYILPARQVVSSSARMDRSDRGDYLFDVSMKALTAREALGLADSALDDWLGCLAARGIAMYRVHDGRREVLLRSAADYDHDTEDLPLDAVVLVETPEGYRWRDPDGELRRSGRLPEIRVGPIGVTRSDLQREVGWFRERHNWSARLRRAMALGYAAECSEDPDGRFAEWYFALEVLSRPQSEALATSRLPKPQERRRFYRDLQKLFEGYCFTGPEMERLLDGVRNTHTRSPLDAQTEYLRELGMNVRRDDLQWWRSQRGKFVHSAETDGSLAARARRDSLCDLGRRCLATELNRLSGGELEMIVMLGR